MRTKYFILICLLFFSCSGKNNLVLPTSSQIEWAEAELGVIIHYDINVFAPETFNYSDSNTLPDLNVFNPTKLNTDQWLDAAQSIGAKYAVLVAKHGTGFCLWPSQANTYHVGNTPWRKGQGDIVADFIQSCKERNINPGIYYNTNYNTLYGAGYIQLSEQQQKEYHNVVLKQLEELWTNYGTLFEIWFDGGVMTDEKGGIASEVNKMIRKNQSTAILFQGPAEADNLIRWIGNEDGRAPYPNWSVANATTSSDGVVEIEGLGGSSDGKIWCPAEADFPNRRKSAWNGGWLWRAGEEEHIFSAEELLDRYYTSVGCNANMLVGMVIDTAGLFPSTDLKEFVSFGKEIKRRFEKSIAETSGKGNIVLRLDKNPVEINHIIIQEDIKNGERIRKYVVEAYINNKWIPVCDGFSVGHKRIQNFPVIKTTKIRLKTEESIAKPNIKNFSAYFIDD